MGVKLSKCPLSDADCKKLDQLLQSCADTACILESIRSIGLDVQPLTDQNQSDLEFATRTKAAFFPDRP